MRRGGISVRDEIDGGVGMHKKDATAAAKG
jgi:hypothetical protein